MLGSFAGDVALMIGAQGGVYLGGGLVEHLSPMLEDTPFRQRFEEKGRLADFVSAIPTFIITGRLAALVVIAVFSLSSIPIAAGAHYDVAFAHELGNKIHNHASRFHLSEFSEYDSITPNHKHTGSKAPVIENADSSCDHMADHSWHIHTVENGCHKHQGKSFINTEEREYFSFIKLSVAAPSVKAYMSLGHNTRPIRGPPASLI